MHARNRMPMSRNLPINESSLKEVYDDTVDLSLNNSQIVELNRIKYQDIGHTHFKEKSNF